MRARGWLCGVLAVTLLAAGCKEEKEDWTELHEAVRYGKLQEVQRLITRGANVNVTDNDGDTPLHEAALRGQREVVELLLAHGADTGLRNHRGETARDMAARLRHNDIVQLLTAQAGEATHAPPSGTERQ